MKMAATVFLDQRVAGENNTKLLIGRQPLSPLVSESRT